MESQPKDQLQLELSPIHLRIRPVALGTPSEHQKSQWYYQRYVEHFPSAGEIDVFDRS